jgi:hypothetical protein
MTVQEFSRALETNGTKHTACLAPEKWGGMSGPTRFTSHLPRRPALKCS